MGIEIENSIRYLTDMRKTYQADTEMVSIAIDTMLKYQKIEAIVNSPVYIQEDVIRYKMICEVLGAPRP